jgi:hypothetical protein
MSIGMMKQSYKKGGMMELRADEILKKTGEDAFREGIKGWE